MITWIKDHLVPEAREWWKLWSERINALGLLLLSWAWFDPVSLLAVWNMMPAAVRGILPPDALLLIGAALFALSMIARLVVQPKLKERI